MTTEINIYVTKTELIKDDGILNKNALLLLEALKLELINLFQGLTIIPNIQGYWIDSNNNSVCVDHNEIWQILTDKDLRQIENKYIANHALRIIEAIKITTKQKSQLYTVKRDTEINFI